MVKSRRSASATKSRPNATLARRPSVSTSWRSVVVSIGRPSTMIVTVPWATPVERDLESRRSRAANRLRRSSAVVARSKSNAGSPSARSRTAPPTSRVSSPPPLSASSARASGPCLSGAEILEPAARQTAAGPSFDPPGDQDAVFDMRRNVDAAAAGREGVDGDEPEDRGGQAERASGSTRARASSARPRADSGRAATR